MLENTRERHRKAIAWMNCKKLPIMFPSLHSLQLFDFPRTWDTPGAQADVSSATRSSTMTRLHATEDQTALRVLDHRWLWELLAQFCLGGKNQQQGALPMALNLCCSYLYLGKMMRKTRTCLKFSSKTWCPAAKTFESELPVGSLKDETLSGLKWQNLLP